MRAFLAFFSLMRYSSWFLEYLPSTPRACLCVCVCACTFAFVRVRVCVPEGAGGGAFRLSACSYAKMSACVR